MIELVRATPAHVGRIANRMRAADVIECAAMGHSPKAALRSGLMNSSEVWTAKANGVPEAMFGVVVTSALGGLGAPWMLGTDEIYRHPRQMIRWGNSILNRWLDSTPHLSNYVSTGNHSAIRLLRRWGCTFGREVITFTGTEFVTFTLER